MFFFQTFQIESFTSSIFRTPLLAEWHEIIYQSGGNLTQLLCGKRGSVYVISEKVIKVGRNGREKHSVKIHVE
jgi:hypothetical protein